MDRGIAVCLSVCLSACLYAFPHDDAKTTESSDTKFDIHADLEAPRDLGCKRSNVKIEWVRTQVASVALIECSSRITVTTTTKVCLSIYNGRGSTTDLNKTRDAHARMSQSVKHDVI